MSKVSDADAGAKIVAAWLGYLWEGLSERSVTLGGFPVFTAERFQGGKDDLRSLVRALEAVSSIHEAEPVAWVPVDQIGQVHYIEIQTSLDDFASHWAEDGYIFKPLYANPDPISKGVTDHIAEAGKMVTAKALEWEPAALTKRIGFVVRVASSAFGEYQIVKGSQGLFDGFREFRQVTGSYREIEDAEAALQSDFDARVLACLSHNAGEIEAGGEVERRVLAEVLTHERNASHSDLDDQYDAIAQQKRAEAAEKRLADLAEQAFRDGVAYATNCEVTDVDLVWSQSRVRAALKEQLL